MARVPATLLIVSLPLFFLPSSLAHDDVVLQRVALDHYLYAHLHSHPEDAIGPGCPTFCPTPQTDTSVLLEIWEETNGCTGLQREESSCSGIVAPPDTRVRGLYATAP